MVKRIVCAGVAVAALLVFCGKDSGTGPDDGSNSVTALFERDTAAIRAILVANNLGHITVDSRIRWRDDTTYTRTRVTRLHLTPGTLGGSRISILPADIRVLTGLQELRLDSNQLGMLPAEIGELTNLVTLLARSNQISTLPPQVGNLRSLTTLKVDRNNLAALPAEMGNLLVLNNFTLAHNRLTAFPDQAAGMSSLSVLDFSGNRVCTTPTAAVIAWFETIEFLAGIDWTASGWHNDVGQICD